MQHNRLAAWSIGLEIDAQFRSPRNTTGTLTVIASSVGQVVGRRATGNPFDRRTPMPNRDLAPWTGSRDITPFDRDPFALFRRQVDRLFDDFFTPPETRSFGTAASPVVWPSVDVHETDQTYRLTAELPGLEQKDVEVSLRDNALTISGEKRQEHKEEDGARAYAERSFGRFQRTIPLEAEVDADKVQASFKNGVLTVEAPKNPAARDKTRRIEVKAQP
jgi:HSP20 family protein